MSLALPAEKKKEKKKLKSFFVEKSFEEVALLQSFGEGLSFISFRYTLFGS